MLPEPLMPRLRASDSIGDWLMILPEPLMLMLSSPGVEAKILMGSWGSMQFAL
ncbi:MAG: hypothetical protein BWY66_01479 [bacterium ADurb.Bin374]|nr:MAG: hypothetical protein BWY66_01479 [bacterium ADurb.Bin374]